MQQFNNTSILDQINNVKIIQDITEVANEFGVSVDKLAPPDFVLPLAVRVEMGMITRETMKSALRARLKASKLVSSSILRGDLQKSGFRLLSEVAKNKKVII